jgi:hypothetical protein
MLRQSLRRHCQKGNKRLGRLGNALFVLAAGAIIAVAAVLVPSEIGHSTHMQLGLDGCTMLRWTGIPCPMCGMTTSFALMADLRPLDAFLNQPFSVVLFGITLFIFGLSGLDLVRPNDRWSKFSLWFRRYEIRAAVVGIIWFSAAWAYKVWLLW